MKLYWYWSFNPQKARLALEELELGYELVQVDLGRGEQKRGEHADRLPRGQLPVLEADDGWRLDESNAIVSYLGESTGRLWPVDARGRAEAYRWLFFESSALFEPAGTLWFYESIAPMVGFEVDREAVRRAHERVRAPLDHLEAQLARGHWLMGEDVTLVDCAIGPVMAAASASTLDWRSWPHVASYIGRLRERPAWQRCDFRF